MDDTGAAMFSELLTAIRGDGAVGTTALECKRMAPAVLVDIQQARLLLRVGTDASLGPRLVMPFLCGTGNWICAEHSWQGLCVADSMTVSKNTELSWHCSIMSQEMMRHLQVMLEMGAELEGSPAALQLERQLPLYFEVRS